MIRYFKIVLVATAVFGWKTRAQKLQEGNTCQLAAFIPFTDERNGPPEDHIDPNEVFYGYGSWPNAESLAKASFSLMAAAEMARRHFNERNPIIVPELSDYQHCAITMPDTIYLDSGYNRGRAVDELLKVSNPLQNDICAVIAPIDPRSNEGISALTAAKKIPQIAYATIDHRLSRQYDFPTFARVIPEANDFALAIAKYVLKRENVAIVYDKSDYGEQFEEPLENAERLLHYESMAEYFLEEKIETIREALTEVRRKGFHTIVLFTDRPAVLEAFAEIADELGLVGDDFFWMLSGASLPPSYLSTLSYQVDSPMDRLLRGAALFTNYDRFVYADETDPFLSAWRNQTASAFLQLKLIERPTASVLRLSGASYFATEFPSVYASFIYDAVMAAGISACDAVDDVHNVSGSAVPHFESLLESSFQGASGPVAFKYSEEDQKYMNSRDPTGVLFGVYNIRPGDIDKNNTRSYEAVLTSLYHGDVEFEGNGTWEDVPGTKFIFSDGTTDEPMPLRTTYDAHYLSNGIQMAGFVLAALALMLVIASGIWVFLLRQTRLVKASQPTFLYLLCFGAALVAPSVVFISFDEDKGVSEQVLSSLCSAFPWCFVIGFLTMYCALFCKLWRLNKLLQLRRRAVRTWQVLFPFAILITSSVVVLVVWQVTDPLVWERETIEDSEPLETYGHCSSKGHGVVPYIVPLACLMGLAMLFTAFFAWKLRDVQAELSAAKWILIGILTHLQIMVIGIPIIYITQDVSRDASYLMYVAVAFTLSTSQVALVIWPKIFVWARDRYFGGSGRRMTNLSVMTPVGPRVSGLKSFRTKSKENDSGFYSSSQYDRVYQLESQLKEEMRAKQDGESRISELESLVSNLRREIADFRNGHCGEVSQLEAQLKDELRAKQDGESRISELESLVSNLRRELADFHNDHCGGVSDKEISEHSPTSRQETSLT